MSDERHGLHGAARRTICCDFDGVLHQYVSQWWGPEDIPDQPVEGAFAWLRRMVLDLDVVILSTRAATEEGRLAMHQWFLRHGLNAATLGALVLTDRKPAAVLYIDDRAWPFTGPGSMPDLDDIEDFVPWNRKP